MAVKNVGGYVLEERIGGGRYGVCYLARQPGGASVVVKKFRPGVFKKNKEKNWHEAVILSRLREGRIPALLGVVNEKNFYGFVLEYKPGQTLKDMLFKDRHVFTEAEVFQTVRELIEILVYLHANGVVHRDVRPPNVLYDNGQVYLIDFGLARWADNAKYPLSLDYSYLGDLLLYLLYSSYEKKRGRGRLPWYNELPLDDGRKLFLKKLFGLEPVYHSMEEIQEGFTRAFSPCAGPCADEKNI
jgi:serine/threonine-protein kinase